MGLSWGLGGRIFLEIGKNSYCSEMYAYGWLSRYYKKGEKLPQIDVNRSETRQLDAPESWHAMYEFTTVGDTYVEEQELAIAEE